MADPASMTDDELKNAINPDDTSKVAPGVPETEKPEPSKPPEPSVAPSPPEPSTPPENEEEEEAKPPTRRESLRIAQLIDKLKTKEEPAAPAASGGMDYSKTLDADPKVIEQLEADRKAASDTSYQRGIEQANSIRFHTRLEVDAPKIEAKYPIFDKDSEHFNPVVANSINQWYLASTGFDPKTDTVKNSDIRYADFVESIMELADEMAGEKTSVSTKNIAKQAATAGIRPDGGSSKRLNLNKPPEQMSDEELKAVIESAGMTA